MAEEPNRNALNWFEIPVVDFDRARKFYGAIFATELKTFNVGPLQLASLPCGPGTGVGGALIKEEGVAPSAQGTVVYLNANPDLAPVLARVEAAGGKVLKPKTQVTEEIGYCAYFLDTEGNRVALHSSK
ncbi:MAG: VOC family protein [bacterium]